MQISRSISALSLALSLLAAALPTAAQPAPQNQPNPAARGPVLQNPSTQNSAAQNPAPMPSAIPANGKEVSLLAVVRDKKGAPVSTLDKQDFVLEQDGRGQTITQVTPQSGLPLTLGVLADTGLGQRKALPDERKASTAFLQRLLRESTDHGFVLHFDKEVELLQDVTASHDKLAKGIEQIAAEATPPGSGREPGKHGRGDADPDHPHFFFGGTMLYDAIFLSSDEVLKGQQGRKAIVLFSDGVDRASKTSLARAIEAAQRAEVLVYCVYVAAEREREEQEGGEGGHGGAGYPGGGYPGGGGPYPGGGYPGGGYPGGPYPGGGGPFPGGGRRRGPENAPRENKVDGKKILQQIAGETGGRYFELTKKMSAAEIYAQIEEELRHQYRLSYTPDQAGSGFHALHLSTRNRDLTVQTRAGFYAE